MENNPNEDEKQRLEGEIEEEREKLQTVVATTNMQVDEFQHLATAKINAMNFKVEKKE